MLLWLFLVGTTAFFYNAFFIGANDVANSFATSVGAGVLTLRQVKYIAGFFEFFGAFLMGSRVSKTIRKGIVQLKVFKNHPGALMLGMVVSNVSPGITLQIATYFGMPISTTHSTVGAIIGFALVFGGYDAVKWGWFEFKGFSKIIISWFTSPFISAFVAYLLFNILKFTVINSKDPYENIFKVFPVLASFTVCLGMMFIIYKGSPQLELDDMELGTSFAIAIPCSIAVGLATWFFYVPWKRRKMDDLKAKHEAELAEEAANVANIEEQPDVINLDNDTIVRTSAAGEARETVIDRPSTPEEDTIIDLNGVDDKQEQIKILKEHIKDRQNDIKAEKVGKLHVYAKPISEDVEKLCSSLQVCTACFSSFAHGANDVANSAAPYATVYAMYQELPVEKKNDVPIWILFLGGLWIVIGLSILGYRVIDTIGTRLTKVTASRGFLIEWSAAFTTLLASRLELPVSTTHCQIGAVIGCGLGDNDWKNINWGLSKNIFLSWIFTVPLAGLISAGLFFICNTDYD